MMSEKLSILALLPLLFMLHDFEEIVLMKPWFNHNKDDLIQKFPKLGKRMTEHFESFGTSAFALAVAEEFLLLSLISIAAILSTSCLLLWFAVMMAFTIHLLYHLLTAALLRRYTVASATSLIFLPISLVIIFIFLQNYHFGIESLFIWTILGLFIMFANLFFLHGWLVPRFENWLRKYNPQNND